MLLPCGILCGESVASALEIAGESCQEYVDPVPSVWRCTTLALVAELSMGLLVEGCVRLGDGGDGSGAVAGGGGAWGWGMDVCVAGADIGGTGCDTVAAAAAAAYRIGVRGVVVVVGVVADAVAGKFRERMLDIGFSAKFGGGLATGVGQLRGHTRHKI